MPPKRVCSDKEPLGNNKVRENPGVCFKKGLRAGFAAGLQKAQKKQIKMNIIGKENIKQGALKIQAVRGVRRARETAARQAEQAMRQRENAMMSINDVNIEAPRVKPAGRRQKFRNYYGLDNAAEVVAQNPVAAPPAPVLINIKTWIDGRGGRPVGVKNRSDLLAELVQNERFPNIPTGLTNIKKLGKARMIQLLLETGRYDRGGER